MSKTERSDVKNTRNKRIQLLAGKRQRIGHYPRKEKLLSFRLTKRCNICKCGGFGMRPYLRVPLLQIFGRWSTITIRVTLSATHHHGAEWVKQMLPTLLQKMRNVFVFRESQWLPVPKYKWMMYDCMRTWRSSLITISSATPHLPGYTWPSTLLCYISLFSGCWNIYITITKRSVQRSVERLPSWTTGNTCPIAYRQKHNYTKHIETFFWFGL